MAKKLKFLVILAISVVFVLLPQIAHPLNYDQISQIAQEMTVLIDGCDSGSGFIYQRQENAYYVVTAKHVFDNSTVGCLAIAPDGTPYDIDSQDITIPIPGVDLAVVSFSSDQDYEQASFGDSQQATSGKTVYVVGAPAPSAAIPQRTTLTVDGNIVGRQSSQEGYELIYNNATSPGMSGGAVFNTQGQVIGIHGQGDRINTEKTGLNLAIPIETFLNADLGNLPQPLISANSSSIPEESEETVEVNYTTLENQLKTLAWKEANDTTVKILLQLVGREDEGWFSKESLTQLPCNDLQFIDSLWQKYSNNKFGFSVQQNLFEQTVIQLGVRNVSSFNKFAELVGWRQGFSGKDKYYDHINYNLNAPQGHLPVFPGVIPLLPIIVIQNDVSAPIPASEDKSTRSFWWKLSGFFIVFFAIVFTMLGTIIKKSSSDNIRNIHNIGFNFGFFGFFIAIFIFIVITFSNCSHYINNVNNLQSEIKQKQKQKFEMLNKNRPINGSELVAGVEPLISTLERCEFSKSK